ncbi:MAG: hypothetical protein ACLRX6_03365 [Limosilactobacillus pontis]|uniref:hypothetical protein n=1 Tax=Limosilactobacillus pontis TaxID=35787 RepID=UPI00399FB688
MKPSISVEAIKECNGDEAKAAGVMLTIAMAILYATTFIANAWIMPDKIMTMALLILAAIEIVLVFPRLAKIGKLYSGTVEEQVKKWQTSDKSYKHILGFTGNLIETGVICVALYLIFRYVLEVKL